MEKKNNKKLFAIIGGSVLAFILTIALSVSITLAYFGQTVQAKDTTLVMGAILKFDDEKQPAVTTAGADFDEMLPGQSGTVTLKGTVAGSTTEYYLRFKLSHNYEGNVITITPAAKISDGNTEYTISEAKDGYYYVLVGGTGADKDNVKAFTTEANTEYTAVMTVSIPASVTNSQRVAEVKIQAEMGIIQAAELSNVVDTLHTEWGQTEVVNKNQ